MRSALFALTLAACGGDISTPADDASATPCGSDIDCKADRICIDGRCEAPPPADLSAAVDRWSMSDAASLDAGVSDSALPPDLFGVPCAEEGRPCCHVDIGTFGYCLGGVGCGIVYDDMGSAVHDRCSTCGYPGAPPCKGVACFYSVRLKNQIDPRPVCIRADGCGEHRFNKDGSPAYVPCCDLNGQPLARGVLWTNGYCDVSSTCQPLANGMIGCQ